MRWLQVHSVSMSSRVSLPSKIKLEESFRIFRSELRRRPVRSDTRSGSDSRRCPVDPLSRKHSVRSPRVRDMVFQIHTSRSLTSSDTFVYASRREAHTPPFSSYHFQGIQPSFPKSQLPSVMLNWAEWVGEMRGPKTEFLIAPLDEFQSGAAPQ